MAERIKLLIQKRIFLESQIIMLTNLEKQGRQCDVKNANGASHRFVSCIQGI